MKISVLIPTYNSSKTIRATLDSVSQQTLLPSEILVLDDGSTDDTVSILNSYKPKITVLQQKNSGVAATRNTLCQRANGDLIAFLDHDDIWHPSYLAVQRRLFEDYPKAVVFFTGHVNFYGYRHFQWNTDPSSVHPNTALLDPLSFLRYYNKTTGLFASMSFCCISKRAFKEIGPEPFCVNVSGADDFYLFNLLPIFGPAVYASVPLVAYLITHEAQSQNRLKSLELSINAFQLLEQRYRELSDEKLYGAFRTAFASRRRQYAKILMGAGNPWEARRQLWRSVRNTNNPSSMAKSLALLLSTLMPALLQPKWLPSYRELSVSQSELNEDER